MYMYYDRSYFLIILAMAIAGLAQHWVRSTFDKYNQWETERHITGQQAAELILRANGIHDVQIEPVKGYLTDHYDPANKVLRLSEATYNRRSISAVAVAAHECGHAIQDAVDYKMMRVRASLVPVVNIGSRMAMPLILIGLLMGMVGLIKVGIIAFSLVLVFQIVTLPVEFDASRRAMDILATSVFTPAEVIPARRVLRAAGFTYVAAALGTVLQIIRFISMTQRRND